MKKSAKDRVFDELVRLTVDQPYVTAEKISQNLKLSRQNVSHYLSRLIEDEKVEKNFWKTSFMEAFRGIYFRDR